MERRYRAARRRLERYDTRVGWIRERSEIAARQFRSSSLDFVYIDANHSYDHVRCDLRLWYPKVRAGGLIAGHDYFDAIADDALEPCFVCGSIEPELLTSYGVKSAVDEFTANLNILPANTAEKYSTWYFEKPKQMDRNIEGMRGS